MITAKQRFYIGLCSLLCLLGGSVIFLFLEEDDTLGRLGIIGSICSLGIGAVLLVSLLREVFRDWWIMINGKRVQGQIKAVESNYWLNLPVIIYYVYRVGESEYEGSTWTTVHYLDRVPAEGADCWVIYDEKRPERSVIDEPLKPAL